MNSKAVAGLIAGALIVGLLVGMALGSDKPTESTASGGTKIVAGVPVGYERSRDGAIRAALNYQAVLSEAVAVPAAERRKLLATVVLPDQLEKVSDEFEVGYRIVDESFALSSGATDAILRSGVLGYRVNAYDQGQAEIAIWEIAIAASERTPPAAGKWSTTTLTLRWTGDWKLAKTPERTDGPVPGSTEPKELVTDVRALEGIRYVPIP